MSRAPLGQARSTPRRVLALLAVAAAALSTVAVAAAEERRARRRVLHEDLTPPRPELAVDPEALARAVFGPEPRAARNPTAIGAGAKLLPEPSTTQPRAAGEILHGGRGFGADRLTGWNPDYETGSDGTLQYVTVFNPSIIPFKRMTSLDAVDENFNLVTRSESRRDLKVGGRGEPSEDLFWASVAVALAPGEDVPIPSVSPDMRILSYEITPPTQITFSKDDADSFYVRSDESGSKGEHRLVFLAAARASYFGADVPRNHRVGHLRTMADRPAIPDLPPRVLETARHALRHPELRIDEDTRLDIAVDRLVAYFRSFEAKPPPPSSGNIYWDLFTSQAGVCRHRSYAFMITANALGIPTRYLANEAHAWVEIWVPRQGWLRVDLGGAALRLQVENASGKSMHRPRGEDSFPKPAAYSENYTRLEGEISGLTSDQFAEARAALSSPDPADEESGGDRTAGAGPGDPPGGPGGITAGPGRTLDEIPPEELAGKAPTRTQVLSATPVGFRGESITVTGLVVDARSAGLEGLRVDIWLAPADQGGDDAILLGRTATVAAGMFAAEVPLPADLSLRVYEVFASTPGNQRHQPSVSE